MSANSHQQVLNLMIYDYIKQNYQCLSNILPKIRQEFRIGNESSASLPGSLIDVCDYWFNKRKHEDDINTQQKANKKLKNEVITNGFGKNAFNAESEDSSNNQFKKNKKSETTKFNSSLNSSKLSLKYEGMII